MNKITKIHIPFSKILRNKKHYAKSSAKEVSFQW